MWDVLVPFVKAHEILQVPEESGTLLVRDLAEGVIRILTLEVGYERRQWIVFSELFNSVLQTLPTNDGTEVTMCFSMDSALDASLEISGPTFVEPEIYGG